jgi:hypothetical protein
VHCDYNFNYNNNYPHTPASAHILYKVINHQTIFQRSIAILQLTSHKGIQNRKHGHTAQGLDLWRLNTSILDVCMHITIYVQYKQWHNNRLYYSICQHQIVKSIHIFIVRTVNIYFQGFIFSIICQLDVLVLYALY